MLENLIDHDFTSLSWMHPYLANPLEGDLFYIHFFQNAFSNHQMQRKALEPMQRIPKILHFIWMGKKAFPKASVKNILSWKKHNPNWRMIFWTDHHQCPIPDMERKLIEPTQELSSLFTQATNPSEKSDYLRFELLRKYGGIYVDHDVECIANFDTIAESSSFLCMQNTFRHTAPFIYRFQGKPTKCLFSIATAVVGSKPNHPLWEEVFYYVKENWDFYTQTWKDFEAARTMHRSFLALSHGIISYLHKHLDPTVCVLPKISLYPHHFKGALFSKLRKKWALCKNKDQNTWVSKKDKKKFKEDWVPTTS